MPSESRTAPRMLPVNCCPSASFAVPSTSRPQSTRQMRFATMIFLPCKPHTDKTCADDRSAMRNHAHRNTLGSFEMFEHGVRDQTKRTLTNGPEGVKKFLNELSNSQNSRSRMTEMTARPLRRFGFAPVALAWLLAAVGLLGQAAGVPAAPTEGDREQWQKVPEILAAMGLS